MALSDSSSYRTAPGTAPRRHMWWPAAGERHTTRWYGSPEEQDRTLTEILDSPTSRKTTPEQALLDETLKEAYESSGHQSESHTENASLPPDLSPVTEGQFLSLGVAKRADTPGDYELEVSRRRYPVRRRRATVRYMTWTAAICGWPYSVSPDDSDRIPVPPLHLHPL